MEYEPFFSHEAEQVFKSLPQEQQILVADAVHRLCGNPSQYGRKAGFPYPPDGMIYTFQEDDPEATDGGRLAFSIRFKFTQDERGIFVITIGHYRLG